MSTRTLTFPLICINFGGLCILRVLLVPGLKMLEIQSFVHAHVSMRIRIFAADFCVDMRSAYSMNSSSPDFKNIWDPESGPCACVYEDAYISVDLH